MSLDHRRAQDIRREEPQMRTYTQPTAGEFLYNSKIWLVFLPCLFVILSLGGKLTMGTAIVGLMVTYICDLRGSKEGALASLWSTLLVTEFGLLFSGVFLFQQSLVNVFLLFNVALFFVTTGMWGSLQVKWITEFQLLTVGMERSSVLLTWAAIASQGIDNAPFYLLLFLAIGFYLFGLPVKSSFRAREDKGYILGRLETAALSGTLVILPALLYLAIYHSVMTRSLLHVTNVVLLVTLPLLFLSLLTNQGSLWWIAPNYYINKQPNTETELYLEKIGKSLRFFIIFIVVGCLEHRLVFHSPSLYHALALFPPYSYIIVTVALYSIVAIFYYLRVTTSGRNARMLLLGLGNLSGFSAGFVLGAPFYVFPFIFLVVYSLVSFYFKRKFINYLLFVVGSVVCLTWFVAKTYAFIEYTFAGLSTGWVAGLVVVQASLTLLVPGLLSIAYDNAPGVAGLVLTLHAVSMAVLEHILHTQDPEIYPYYLVIATTIAGTCVFYKMHQHKKVTLVWRWLGTSLYVSKLALALDAVEYSILYSFFLILSVSVLYIIPSAKMSSQQGLLHAIVIGITVFFSRNAILSQLIFFFTQQHLTSLGSLAIFLVAWGMGLIPLSLKFFSTRPLVRALNLTMLASGALLYFISGQITPSSSGRSQIQQGTAYAKYFLIVGLLSLILVLTSLVNLNRFRKLRIIMPVIIGTCLGLYISGSFIPLPPPRTAYSTATPFAVILQHFLHGTALASAGVFLSLTHWPPPPSSSQIVSWAYGIFVALFPILYSLDNQVYIFAPTQTRKDSIFIARMVLVGLYAALNFLLSLYLKLKISRANTSSDKKKDVQMRRNAPAPTDWNASLGNFATLSTFILSAHLHISYLNGSEIAIVVLAPVLLLLHRDSRLLRNLSESNRYFPIVLTISSVLAFYSFKRIIFLDDIPLYTILWWWRTKNLVLLLLTLPSQYLFNQFLYRSHSPSVSNLIWIIVASCNALPLLFTDLDGVKCLAVVGVVGWIAHYVESVAKKNKARGQVL